MRRLDLLDVVIVVAFLVMLAFIELRRHREMMRRGPPYIDHWGRELRV